MVRHQTPEHKKKHWNLTRWKDFPSLPIRLRLKGFPWLTDRLNGQIFHPLADYLHRINLPRLADRIRPKPARDPQMMLEYINKIANTTEGDKGPLRIQGEEADQLLKLFNHILYRHLKEVIASLTKLDLPDLEENKTLTETEALQLENTLELAESTLEYYRNNHYLLIANTHQLIKDNRRWMLQYYTQKEPEPSLVNIVELLEAGLNPWWSLFPMLETVVVRDIHAAIPKTTLLSIPLFNIITRNLAMTTFCLARLGSVIRLSCFMITGYINIQLSFYVRKEIRADQVIKMENEAKDTDYIAEALTAIQMAAKKMGTVLNIAMESGDNNLCFTIQLPHK